MKATGFIEPRMLDDEEIEQYTDLMRIVHPITTKWAKKCYGTEEPQIKQFRRDFFSGEFDKVIPAKDREAIGMLQQIEYAILQGHVLIAVDVARTFTIARVRPGVSYEDFFQEGCQTIVDCIYTYHGNSKAKFSSYVTGAIKHTLLDVSRLDNPLSPPAPEILQRRSEINEYAEEHELPFEEAGKKLGYDAGAVQSCLRSMANVTSYSQSDNDESFEDTSEYEGEDSNPRIWEALKTADLTDMERDLFESYLRGEEGYRNRIADEYRNPANGKPYTRQNISLIFKRVCRKVQVRYAELVEEIETNKRAA